VTLLAAESVRLIGGGRLLLCGPVHPDALLERFEEDHIDVGRFLDDLGSEPRRRILESLGRNGEGTASELSRDTGLPVTTVLRHMETLSNDLLIMETRRSGLKIYYGLNRRFLERAAGRTVRYLSALGKDARR
jgi:DNA-binding transcriptional ArsR family regulator